MNTSNLLLIGVIEVAVLLFVLSFFLIIQNRSLRKLVAQLKEKAQELVKEIKRARASTVPTALETSQTEAAPAKSYLSYIDEQIEYTRLHHGTLDASQDIALDISPDTPLPLRAAALRHAILLAEKEAFSQTLANEEPDWYSLRSKYEQIFSFYEDFSETADAPEGDDEELESLRSELSNARNRVNNLEKFKKLYFNLEEKWDNTKADAETKYNNLSDIASKMDDSGELNQALDDYHAGYNEVTVILDQGIDDESFIKSASGASSEAASEVKHLRAVAADQHKIIEGLQKRLLSASTEEERNEIVSGLQDELTKQMRFVQESETCIQLLEDELQNAMADVEQLKSRLNHLPQIKSEIISLRKAADAQEIKYHRVVTENKKLQKRLREAGNETQPLKKANSNPEETKRLRKELNEMSAKYNELEEKFLDLKLEQ